MFKIGGKVKFKKTSLDSGMIDATEDDVFSVEHVFPFDLSSDVKTQIWIAGYPGWWNTDHFEHVKEKEIMEEKYIPKVGDKVVGFKFEDNHGSIPTWATRMDKYVGQEGFVFSVKDGYFGIQFEDDWWNYPLSLAHLAKIEETGDREIKWEVGQEVWCLCFGKGVVKEVEESGIYTLTVGFGDDIGDVNYTKEGKLYVSAVSQTLFFSEPKIIAEKFPPKKVFVPKLKKGDTIIYRERGASCSYVGVVDYEDHDSVTLEDSDDSMYKHAFEFHKLGEEIKFS